MTERTRTTLHVPAGPGRTSIPALLVCLGAGISGAAAQELEPRAYSPNPAGVNFLLVSWTHSTGDVLVDTSLPLSDVDARLDTGSLGYGRTFALFDRTASLTLVAPWVWGDLSGDVSEARREVSRSGVADPRLRFSINLVGGPAMAPAEFARRKPRTTLGASLVVVPPIGEYDPDKLVNIGSNRWSFKPELGVSQPIGRWYLEAYAGAWLFTDNDDFFGGSKREQDPIGSLQGHVSYTFRTHLWLAFDATYYRGGRTTLNGVRQEDLQSNTRIGLAFSVPLGSRQSLKFAWTEGATTRAGGDFRTVGVSWQCLWFD